MNEDKEERNVTKSECNDTHTHTHTHRDTHKGTHTHTHTQTRAPHTHSRKTTAKWNETK